MRTLITRPGYNCTDMTALQTQRAERCDRERQKHTYTTTTAWQTHTHRDIYHGFLQNRTRIEARGT